MSKKRTITDYYQHEPANKKRKLIQDNDIQKDDNKSDEKLEKNCMDISKLKGIEYKWEDNATVIYYEKFLKEEKVKQLWNELLKLNFEQSEFKMFGKPVKVPRMQCWMSDDGITNKMAHLFQKQDGYKWSNNILFIKNSIEKLINCKFNYVLINYYRNGNDYIAWHSDKEAIPKCRNIVGSISLGGPRKFCFRHNQWKKKKIEKKEFLLPSGCLIIMKDDTQKEWKHSVPKSKKPQKPRINLTFRQCCDCLVCSK